MDTLHQIVETGNIKKVSNFLKNHNDIKNIINKYNEDGKTALHIAVFNNYQSIADLLVKSGADKNIVDGNGQKVVWIPEQKGGKYKKIYGKRYI